MNIYDLIIFSLVILAIAAVINHINISRFASRAAKRHCEQHNLQLLDQNVVLKRLWLRRSSQQLFAIERTYRFEFSSIGDHRYGGKLVLLSKRLDHIELDVYKTQSDE